MDYPEIIGEIKSLYNEKNVAGMARYGINIKNAYGLSAPVLKKMAKDIRRNHNLALQLWNSEIHDARILAFFIEQPDKVTEGQMENWVKDFDSWDICDGCCLHLFRKTKYAYKKINEWCSKEEEFIKRAGFVLIAVLAVHDKKADDNVFLEFLPVIKKGAVDERNFVKKAVNWALRQIGKRNLNLNKTAIRTAEDIKKLDSKAARWIANDALRELKSEKIQRRLIG